MADPTAVDPVTASPGRSRPPEPGIALCLSGGGYRAMLFHVGSLWRLNELGYLNVLKRISSVSGGSITAGRLALSWPRLDFDAGGVARRYEAEVAGPIRGLASKTIDRGAILRGTLLPGEVSDRVVAAYREHLFDDATLQDIPDSPRFVINATNVQSGALWRFSRNAMRDYRVGSIPNPTLPLARRRRRIVRVPARAVAGEAFARSVALRAAHRRRGSAPAAVHDRRRPDRRRRVRQPRARDGLEALRHDSRQRRRRQDGRRTGAAHRLGAAQHPHQRDHRQPGPQPAKAPGRRRVREWTPEGRLLGHPHRHRGLRACPMPCRARSRRRPRSPTFPPG